MMPAVQPVSTAKNILALLTILASIFPPARKLIIYYDDAKAEKVKINKNITININFFSSPITSQVQGQHFSTIFHFPSAELSDSFRGGGSFPLTA